MKQDDGSLVGYSAQGMQDRINDLSGGWAHGPAKWDSQYGITLFAGRINRCDARPIGRRACKKGPGNSTVGQHDCSAGRPTLDRPNSPCEGRLHALRKKSRIIRCFFAHNSTETWQTVAQ